jgi:PBP1b-binding outer membrane lipoprotein LpoB
MKQSLSAIAVVLLGIFLVGCSGRGGSPESVVDRALTAVKNGDKATLVACFMPGSTPPAFKNACFDELVQMLEQGSLRGVTWRIAPDTMFHDTQDTKNLLAEFSAPVTVGSNTGKSLQVPVERDTAHVRTVLFGRYLPTGIPEPTGQWVMVTCGLRS